MNSNFLKKIFKCRQYNADYKEFLRKEFFEFRAFSQRLYLRQQEEDKVYE